MRDFGNGWNGRALLLAAGVASLAGGCGAGQDAGGEPSPSSDAGVFGVSDAAPARQCFSSNECPTGFVCSEFGFCEAPPQTDAATFSVPRSRGWLRPAPARSSLATPT